MNYFRSLASARLHSMNTYDLHNNWGEYSMVISGLVGFFLTFFFHNHFFTAVSSLILGFISARTYFLKNNSAPILPFALSLAFLILGIMLACLIRGLFFISVWYILPIFFTSYYWSYSLHNRDVMGTFKSKNFLK